MAPAFGTSESNWAARVRIYVVYDMTDAGGRIIVPVINIQCNCNAYRK